MSVWYVLQVLFLDRPFKQHLYFILHARRNVCFFSCIIILTLRTLPGKPKKQYSDFLEYYPHLLNYFVD